MVLERIERRFRGDGGQYKEKIWVGGTLGEYPDQIGGSCTQHALTRVVEYKHLYHHQQQGSFPPFNKLSVQFVIDRSNSRSYDYANWHSREKSVEAIVNDGILDYQDYALEGLRGENNWKPNRDISTKTRYGVHNFLRIEDVGTSVQKFKEVRAALDEGPVYIDFGVDSKYDKHVGCLPHKGGDHASHAVCCVGYGSFLKHGKDTQYLVYANSYGPGWGYDGLGRIRWQFVNIALIPIGLRCFQRPTRRTPPVYATSGTTSNVQTTSRCAEGPGLVR